MPEPGKSCEFMGNRTSAAAAAMLFASSLVLPAIPTGLHAVAAAPRNFQASRCRAAAVTTGFSSIAIFAGGNAGDGAATMAPDADEGNSNPDPIRLRR